MDTDNVVAPPPSETAATAGGDTSVRPAESSVAESSSSPYQGYKPVLYSDIYASTEKAQVLREISLDPELASSALPEEIAAGQRMLNKNYLLVITLLSLFFVFSALAFIPTVSCALGLCDQYDLAPSSTKQLLLFDFTVPTESVWGAFTTGVLGLIVTVVYFFIVITKNVCTSVRMHELSKFIQSGVKTFLVHENICFLCLSVPLCLLLGFGVSWPTAGSFGIGVVFAALASWTSIFFAAKANALIASATHVSLSKGMRVVFRTASVIALCSLSFSLCGLSATYAIFKNVKALLGFAAGASSVALFSRITGSIFHTAQVLGARLAANLEDQVPQHNARNPACTAERVGELVVGVSSMSLHLFESLAAAIVVTAVLAASLPYVQDNPYAMCVFNHLIIDHDCIAYDRATIKVSFAAQICRQADYYKKFPSLTAAQSNSVFVALPFLLGIVTLLTTITVTICLFISKSSESDDPKVAAAALRKSLRFTSILATVLMIGSAAALSWGLFGAGSNFYQGSALSTIPRHDLNDPSDGTRCVPSNNILGDSGTNLPTLTEKVGLYKPLNSYGAHYPSPTSTPWRLFLCMVIGLALGRIASDISAYATSPRREPAHSIAKVAASSAGDAIIRSIGIGTLWMALPFALLVASALSSHALYGSYGVALTAVGTLSTLGISAALQACEALAQNAAGIAVMSETNRSIQRGTRVLETVGGCANVIGKSLSAGSGVLISYALFSQYLFDSGLVPSAGELIGSATRNPVRHISDIDELSAIDVGVIVSTFIGVLLPFAICALIFLSIARVTHCIITEVRNQFQKSTGLRDGVAGIWPDYKALIRVSARFSLFEMFPPAILIIITPLVVGFGLGQRALTGMILGMIGCGFALGNSITVAGIAWTRTRRSIEDENHTNETSEMSQVLKAFDTGNVLGLAFRNAGTLSLNIAVKLLAIISTLAAPLMNAGVALWFVGVAIFAAMAFFTLAMLRFSCVRQRSIRRRSTQLDVETLRFAKERFEKEDQLRKLEALKVSPFYASGATLARQRIAPQSTMGHGRVHPDSMVHHELDSLRTPQTWADIDE